VAPRIPWGLFDFKEKKPGPKTTGQTGENIIYRIGEDLETRDFTSRKGVERSFQIKAEKTSARRENLGFPLGSRAPKARGDRAREGIRKIFL